jgi:hypothetical protein
VTLVSALNGYLFPLMVLWSWCFGGTGLTPVAVRMAVVAAAVNIVGSVSLTYWLRLTVGPLLGTSAAFLLVEMWTYPRLLRSYLGVPIGPLLRAVLAPLAVGLPASALFWAALRAYPPGSLPAVIVAMGAATAAILALCFVFVFDAAGRREWLGRAVQVLPGRRGVGR